MSTGTEIQLETTTQIESWIATCINTFLVLHSRYRWLAVNPVGTMPLETTIKDGGETEIVARTPLGSTLAVPKAVFDSTTDEELWNRAQDCFVALLEIRPTTARTLAVEDCTLTVVVGELHDLTVTQRERLCHRLMQACLKRYYSAFTDEVVPFDGSFVDASPPASDDTSAE
jgi:hypothetical protein